MNQVTLIGRVATDLKLKKVGVSSVLNFVIAVNRDYKNDKGEAITDFLNVTVWKQGAEFLAKYSKKGDLVSVVGSIIKRSYEKDGETIWVVDILARNVQLITGSEKKEKPAAKKEESKENLAEGEELPF
jgi:single-strand DNA-binding protein